MRYLAFGQTVDSPIPLLAPANDSNNAPSIQIRTVEKLSWQPQTLTDDWFQAAVGPEKQNYLKWQGIAEFLISESGSEISVHWLGRPSNELFNAYLLTQAISSALINKGFECFHGTSVKTEAGTIIFLGESGQGKSTLAMEFLKRGAQLVSDDIIVFTTDYTQIHSTLNRMKLYPEALDLSGLPYAGVPLNPYTEKSLVPLAQEQMSHGAQSVKAIFVLSDRGPTLQIQPFSYSESVAALAGELFNTIHLPQKRVERLFHAASLIAKRYPVCSISLPDDLKQLSNSVQKIIEYVNEV